MRAEGLEVLRTDRNRLMRLGPNTRGFAGILLICWKPCSLTESPNVSGDDRSVLPLPGPMRSKQRPADEQKSIDFTA
jgi:hypothetical protein